MIPRPIRLSDGFGLVRTVRLPSGEPVRVMQVGGVYQGASYEGERRMEPVFAYIKGFDACFELRPDAKDVLMVGGGAYAWPKHVAEAHPGAHVDVVELEAGVIKAARKHFYLDEALERHPGSIGLVWADGRAYVEGSKKRYDVIVLDAFAGMDPVYSLATVEFFEACEGALEPGGVLLANVVSNEEGEDVEFLQSFVASAREAFAHVEMRLVDNDEYAVEDNYLVAASNEPFELEGSIAYGDEFLGPVLRD